MQGGLVEVGRTRTGTDTPGGVFRPGSVLTRLINLDPFYSRHNLLHRKSKLLKQLRRRTACSEAVHGHRLSVQSGVPFPSQSRLNASTATLRLTVLGRTDSLYSADCSSNKSVHGMDTTRTFIPSAASAFFGLYCQSYLRSCCNQDCVRRSVTVVYDVASPLRPPCCFPPLVPDSAWSGREPSVYALRSRRCTRPPVSQSHHMAGIHGSWALL